jgi:hypothetical protein
MKRGRLFGFILMIAIGLAVGLLYGWVINPPEVKNTTLASLRKDYQADYVLMVAEAYLVNQDVGSAVKMLSNLGSSAPLEPVQKALLTAQEIGYSIQDLQLIANLERGLRQVTAPVELATP